MRLITMVKRLLTRDTRPSNEELREEAATSEGMPPAAVSRDRSR